MESMMLNERITKIDTMKALLIIAMVVGHSTSPWGTYIYLFHMPAFMILSGYTYNGARYTVRNYIKKKLLSILFPAYLINLLYIFIYCILQRTDLFSIISSNAPITLGQRISGLFLYLSTPDWGGATWFLFVLFETECIVKVIETFFNKIKKGKYFVYIIIAMGFGGYLFIEYKHILPYSIDLALMSCLYFGAGLLLHKSKLLNDIDNKVMIPFCVITTIFFGSFYFYGLTPMNWPTRNFSNLFIQLLSCFASTYVAWCIASWLDDSRICFITRWIGKHTYCILVTHFVVFKLLFVLGGYTGLVSAGQMQQLVPEWETASNGGWLIISVTTVLICCVIARLAERNRWLNYIFNAKVNYKK